jgi:hypothetical protein
LALLSAYASYCFEVFFHLHDASLNFAPIGFQLSFTGTSGADAAAELGHGFAASRQTGKHVFELCQLNLELTFTRTRMTGEDVENKLRSVKDAAGQAFFQIAQLCGRQVMVE